MKTVIYLLSAFAVASLSILYLGAAGTGVTIFFILMGFALVGASAFTAYYSKLCGEKGGRMVTFVLRNFLGMPLWFTGLVIAWLAPSPYLFNPNNSRISIGWLSVAAGAIPFIRGHIELGRITHMPSMRDTLVRSGLYAHVRHPTYAGAMLIFIGLALLKPTLSFAAACTLGFIWLIIQTRLEETDLLQRMPDYQEYMKETPRFVPYLRQRR